MSVNIRPFVPEDRTEVIELWTRSGLVRPWNDPGQDIDRKRQVAPELFLVEEEDGHVVGCVMAGYEGHRGWLNYLAVDPAHRRKGLGRRLVTEAERRLSGLGCPKVNLQVRSSNTDAVEFYRRIGYAVDDVVSMGSDWRPTRLDSPFPHVPPEPGIEPSASNHGPNSGSLPQRISGGHRPRCDHMGTGSRDRLLPLEKEVVDHYFVARPTQASGQGLHEYDGILPDLSKGATDRWASTARELLRRLDSLPESGLAPRRRVDRRLLQLLLEGALFDLEEVRELDRNPMSYVFQPDLTNYIIRDYAPIEVRAEAISRILKGLPSLLDIARQRLDRNLPPPFVTLSIQMASGLPSHFAEGESCAKDASASTRASLHDARESADAAVIAFATWLKEDRLPQATGDFALGHERFQRLLWVREGLSVPVEEVLRRGRADLQRNQARLEKIARGEELAPDRMLERLNERHPSRNELIALAQRLTDEAKAFVRESDLATIPEPEACHVRETPPWARDLWTAAMSSPGPFEKPVDGIYWVTTPDPAWTPEQTEGWLRTLNLSMLGNTTVHEVWPGHYLQALHFRTTEQTLARKVWFSYSFCEGWAHYCEQAALEAGFGGRSTDAEVTQLRDALIRDGRLIVSIGMHTQGMSVAEATQFLRTEAHIEEIHAQREAIRGTYNPEYFCYTLGKLAILDARSKYLTSRYGSSLRAFHDALLAFGTPPIGFLDSLLAAP